jgi:hypothetical protein
MVRLRGNGIGQGHDTRSTSGFCRRDETADVIDIEQDDERKDKVDVDDVEAANALGRSTLFLDAVTNASTRLHLRPLTVLLWLYFSIPPHPPLSQQELTVEKLSADLQDTRILVPRDHRIRHLYISTGTFSAPISEYFYFEHIHLQFRAGFGRFHQIVRMDSSACAL